MINQVTALIKHCFGNGIELSKTKSGQGFMIYNQSQIANMSQLVALTEACNWRLIESDEEWDKGTKVRNSRIYIGPAKSNALSSEDEAIELAKSMV